MPAVLVLNFTARPHVTRIILRTLLLKRIYQGQLCQDDISVMFGLATWYPHANTGEHRFVHGESSAAQNGNGYLVRAKVENYQEALSMNIKRNLPYILLSFLLIAGLHGSQSLQASDDASANSPGSSAIRKGKLYLPSDDAVADLATSINSARDNNRLLLVVMGANWCHDSRALASRLFKEPLSTTIDENYEVLFVDVGYLEKGKELITSLGIPVYYATPTVLIVDPVSGKVVNMQNRHQWANAATIGMEESVDYFQLFANTDLDALRNESEPNTELQVLLEEIKAFEQIQADRLYQAYVILTPMLYAYKQGDKDAFSEDTWNEVRDYRYQVSADIEALRAEAYERVATGETDIQLNYPVYPAFSWDSQ